MEGRIQKFGKTLGRYSEIKRKKIMDAASWAEGLHHDQKRASGEPYFIHPLRVAEILVEMQMDYESVIAGLLHDILEDTDIPPSDISKKYGKQVELLVNGVTKISILKAKNKSVQEAETIRKMLFAMIKDIRVIIIKLADKLHNMSTLEHLPAFKRKVIATECLDIYAPLAGRLGISWLKAELEDLSLKHLNPDAYNYIKESLMIRKGERADYLKKIRKTIIKAAKDDGIEIQVAARAKHFYSIYRKMKRRKKDIDEIYDLLGIRILCRSSNECYIILGIVHKLWPPIEGRFKDYIAMPKSNQYQSLHTTVMCFGGKLLEIQIRSGVMHKTAEFGIAAHWAYKSGFSRERINPADLLIINKLKNLDRSKITSSEFLSEIKGELLKDSIYVFTPKGHIVELPKGASPIDYAYHIHTEIGDHCIGAKADGSIIPLNAQLKNTQVIEILTSRNATPHVNWLRSVKTARARAKIRHWLNKHDDSLFIGRSIIAKKNLPDNKKIAEITESDEKDETVIKHVHDQSKVVFKIGNERNMMISIAKCCSPTTGDSILGYISRGRGIIVHRRNCPNLKHINDIKARTIEVAWETVSPKATRRFQVTARITSDLFSEIEGAVKKFNGHLIEGKLIENERGNLTGSFTMELDKPNEYKNVMKSIRTIPAVLNIQSLS